MLTLPIKKQWYDMLLSGEKKEEYREIKPYYTKRFRRITAPPHLDRADSGDEIWLEACRAGRYSDAPFEVLFRNGYSSDSPSFSANVCIRTGTGNTKWGAEEGNEYYILTIINKL